MTPQQIKQAARECAAFISNNICPGATAKEMDEHSKAIQLQYPNERMPIKLNHLLFMCKKIEEFADDPEHIGKANRWLGNVQGILWWSGYVSIDSLKEMNKPASPWPILATDAKGIGTGDMVALASPPGKIPTLTISGRCVGKSADLGAESIEHKLSIAEQEMLKLFEAKFESDPTFIEMVDGTVHDLKSAEASSINNEGKREQFDYILLNLGAKGIEEILERHRRDTRSGGGT